MLDLIREYGPALLVLLIAYFRDKIAEEKNKRRIMELEAKIKENHAKVDARNANRNDADILDDIGKR